MVYESGAGPETTNYLGLMEKVTGSEGTEYRHCIPSAEQIVGIYSRRPSAPIRIDCSIYFKITCSLDTIAASTGFSGSRSVDCI